MFVEVGITMLGGKNILKTVLLQDLFIISRLEKGEAAMTSIAQWVLKASVGSFIYSRRTS